MQEQYLIGLEESLINDISIKETIKRLKVETIDMIQEMYGDIDNYVQGFENKEIAERALESLIKLTCSEQQVILLRFGLLDGNGKTLEKAAEIMGITRERVRQIEVKSIRKLRLIPVCSGRKGAFLRLLDDDDTRDKR